MEDIKLPPPLQAIHHPLMEKYGVQLSVLRLDLIHPLAGGNKWFKLKYNIEQAKAEGHDTLLTFGGAYSNHILATAVAGKLAGIKTIGVIRGEEYSPLNPVLQLATEQGMQLKYISREQYRKKEEASFVSNLHSELGNFYLVPEGGANELGVKGCEEILQYVSQPFEVVCCACGTGATLAGIIRSLQPLQKAIGFSVLKDGDFLADEVNRFLLSPSANWLLQTKYHFGGYAKQTGELLAFLSSFSKQTGVPLDNVYTGKMIYGIFNLIEQGYFSAQTKIVAVHSGNSISGTSQTL